MNRTVSSSLALVTVGILAASVAAKEPHGKLTHEEQYQTDRLAHHAELWKHALQYAGRLCEGIVAEAFVTPRELEMGKPVMFVLSYRNLNDRSVTHEQWVEMGPEEVMIQDSSGKPLPLNEKGRRVWKGWGTGHTGPDRIPIKPGFAIAEKLPIDDFFTMYPPGTYTVLGGGAKPVTFVLWKSDNKTTGTSSPQSVYRPNDPFGKQWQDALTAAGQPHDDLLLESVVSPIDRRAVNLVVSLRNVCTSGKIVPKWGFSVLGEYGSQWDSVRDTSPGVEVTVGIKASEYHVLVQDVAGKTVPLTEDGKKWLASHELTSVHPLRPGEAIGFVFPLHEMFAVKPGQEYSVLVILPGKAANDPAWIATPIKMRTPELEVAGVTRPPFGSDRLWDRLATMAATPRNDVVLDSTIHLQGDSVLLHMDLENMTQDAIRIDVEPCKEVEVVLVRNASGKRVLTNQNAETIRPQWYYTNNWDILYPRGVKAADGNVSNSNAHADYRLHLVYPFRDDASYTVLTAVNLTLSDRYLKEQKHAPEFPTAKNFSALVVAKPVTFTAPRSESCVPDDKPSSPMNQAIQEAIGKEPSVNHGATSVGLPSVPAMPLTFDQKWEQASHFAGEPFEGLSLESASGKPTELKLALHNRSDKSILVKKWKGESDYEILVRAPSGKPVALTEKGRKFFQGGELLDIRRLKPGEAIYSSLRLAELFAIHAPGEYTVLASLPVIGDVDAVLTAKPVKIWVQ